MAWAVALPTPRLSSPLLTSPRASGTCILDVCQREANANFVNSYRFRLVSLSCDPNYTFSVDGHNMTVIEVDGIETQSLTVNAIQIFSAQRYSFVVSDIRPSVQSQS